MVLPLADYQQLLVRTALPDSRNLSMQSQQITWEHDEYSRQCDPVDDAADAVDEVARDYSNLELELSTGKRGGRLDGIRECLRLFCPTVRVG